MTFLAPWFLLGGLAVALPVFFHLIRRSTRERMPFSSLMFLFPTPPRLTKRSRLEHVILLCLRCLVLCLLALGFARPLLKHAVIPTGQAEGRRVLVLVDTSASMRRANLWAEARAKVRSVLAQTRPGDHVALFTFDRQVRQRLSFAQWNVTPAGERVALAISKFKEVDPGWSATRLDAALTQAAEALADAGGKSGSAAGGEIVLISDLQEGSHLERLQGYEWPKNVRVTVEPLKPERIGNASLQLAPEPETGGPLPGGVRVRVSNTPDSRHEQFKIGWTARGQNRFIGSALDAYVPLGQSRVFTLPMPAVEAGLSRILLQGDDEDFDNQAFKAPAERTLIAVLYLGAESATDPRQPLYFLKRAFQETRNQAVQVRVPAEGAPVTSWELNDVPLVIVSEGLSNESASALRSQVIAGKTLLCLLRDGSMGPTLEALTGARQVSIQEEHPRSYAMLGDIDFRHPLFAVFADARFADFTGIHFWRYRRVAPELFPGARVLAKFDSGDPALLEVPVGKGRVLVLTSGWQPGDSQMALSTKFVPLLYSMLEICGVSSSAPAAYQVGDTIPVTPSANLKIIQPDGTTVVLDGPETNFSGTLTPGLYTLVSGRATNRFAVNLDASEGRTSPFSVEELERLGVPLSKTVSSLTSAAGRATHLQNAELENRQKLWRWLLLSALGVLMVETWLGGWATRRAAGASANRVETMQAGGAYR